MKIIREDIQTNSAIEVMANSMDKQNEPDLGIFWYDTSNDELFGIVRTPADEAQYYHSNQWDCDVKTCKKLHETIWKKEHFKDKDKRFSGDYTKIPRGRIFEFKGKGFVVYTGTWIDNYPQVKELIINEFDLPNTTQFKQDEHWDIGHGWSNEF